MFDYKDQNKVFKKINLLHSLSFVLQVLLILILFFFSGRKEEFLISNQESIIYLQYIMILLTLAAIPGSEYFLKMKLEKILQLSDGTKKLEQYITAVIMKLSLVELVSVFAIFIYFFSGNKTFIYISVILTLFFLLSKPGKNKILTDLNM